MFVVLIVLVVLLAITNAATLLYLRRRPDEVPHPDPDVAAVLDRSPAPTGTAGGTRRLISIEILNPIELAGTRGWLAGVAGSIVPGLTRRIVNDQTLKILKHQLAEQQVVADVRLHTLRPVPPEPAGYADEVQPVDLDAIDE